MKKTLLIITLFLLVGCGGSNSSSSSTYFNIIPMQIGQVYVVNSGDQVQKSTEDTQIKIVHTEGESNSTVELIQGSANLIRS